MGWWLCEDSQCGRGGTADEVFDLPPACPECGRKNLDFFERRPGAYDESISTTSYLSDGSDSPSFSGDHTEVEPATQSSQVHLENEDDNASAPPEGDMTAGSEDDSDTTNKSPGGDRKRVRLDNDGRYHVRSSDSHIQDCDHSGRDADQNTTKSE